MARSTDSLQKRGLSRVQRLCCLGLGGEAIVPDIMAELQALVPSEMASFNFLGPGPAAPWIGSYGLEAWPKDLLAIYKQNYTRDVQREVFYSTDEIMNFNTPQNVYVFGMNLLKVDFKTYSRSRFSTDYTSYMPWAGVVGMRIRDPHRALGWVLLPRGNRRGLGSEEKRFRTHPYATSELRILESLSHFIAHGMTARPDAQDGCTEDRDTGVLIATSDGRLRHADARGRALLSMAFHHPSSPFPPAASFAEHELGLLFSRLRATAGNMVGGLPPVMRVRNQWGEFTFRAYWMEPTDGADVTHHSVVSINRRVPRMLAIWRNVERLRLTGREKQLCLLLTRDPGRSDLAEAMGVGQSTAVTHLRNVYAKLGVNGRAALIAALQPD